MSSNFKFKINENINGRVFIHTNSDIDMMNMNESDKGCICSSEITHKKINFNKNNRYKLNKYNDYSIKINILEQPEILVNVFDDIFNLYIETYFENTNRVQITCNANDTYIDETLESNIFKYRIISHINKIKKNENFKIYTVDTNINIINSCIYLKDYIENIGLPLNDIFGISKYRMRANIIGNYTDDDTIIINKAIDKWSKIIYGPVIDSLMQDMLLNIEFKELSPNVLGSAYIQNYFSMDDGNILPIEGTILLNTITWNNQKNIKKTDGNTNAYYTLLHEIGHVLGIGTLFYNPGSNTERKHLINGYKYIGKNGLEKYRINMGNYNLTCIPIEEDYGQGTSGGHLEEGIESENGNRYYDGIHHPGLDRELMTGISENDNEPEILSTISAGMLHDIGFTVKYSACDDVYFPSWVSYNNKNDGLLNYREIIIIHINYNNTTSYLSFTNTNLYNYSNIRLSLSSYSNLTSVSIMCGYNSQIFLYGYTLENTINLDDTIILDKTFVINSNTKYDINLQNKSLNRIIFHLKTIENFKN